MTGGLPPGSPFGVSARLRVCPGKTGVPSGMSWNFAPSAPTASIAPSRRPCASPLLRTIATGVRAPLMSITSILLISSFGSAPLSITYPATAMRLRDGQAESDAALLDESLRRGLDALDRDHEAAFTAGGIGGRIDLEAE